MESCLQICSGGSWQHYDSIIKINKDPAVAGMADSWRQINLLGGQEHRMKLVTESKHVSSLTCEMPRMIFTLMTLKSSCQCHPRSNVCADSRVPLMKTKFQDTNFSKFQDIFSVKNIGKRRWSILFTASHHKKFVHAQKLWKIGH